MTANGPPTTPSMRFDAHEREAVREASIACAGRRRGAWRRMMYDVLAVSDGLRPAAFVDYCVCDPNKLKRLIDTYGNGLSVLVLEDGDGDDLLFIVHARRLAAALERFGDGGDGQRPLLIHLEGCDGPTENNGGCWSAAARACRRIAAALRGGATRVRVGDMGIGLPTIIGLVCTYPVVYAVSPMRAPDASSSGPLGACRFDLRKFTVSMPLSHRSVWFKCIVGPRGSPGSSLACGDGILYSFTAPSGLARAASPEGVNVGEEEEEDGPPPIATRACCPESREMLLHPRGDTWAGPVTVTVENISPCLSLVL